MFCRKQEHHGGEREHRGNWGAVYIQIAPSRFACPTFLTWFTRSPRPAITMIPRTTMQVFNLGLTALHRLSWIEVETEFQHRFSFRLLVAADMHRQQLREGTLLTIQHERKVIKSNTPPRKRIYPRASHHKINPQSTHVAPVTFQPRPFQVVRAIMTKEDGKKIIQPGKHQN